MKYRITYRMPMCNGESMLQCYDFSEKDDVAAIKHFKRVKRKYGITVSDGLPKLEKISLVKV